MNDAAPPPADHTQRDAVTNLKLGMAVAGFGLGTIDYVSDTITLDETAAKLFDLRPRVPLSCDDVHARIHPDSLPTLMALLEDALGPAGTGAFAAEHAILRRDGTVVWVAARKQIEFAAPQTGGPRRAMSGLLAVRDISNRRAAEERLRVSEVRYRRLFEAAHDGVLLLDPTTAKIVDANPFMTRLLGYSHDQLVGKQLFEIGLVKDTAASQEMMVKLSRTHEVRYQNLPLESASGLRRDVEVVANLYDEAGQSIIQFNIRDITERKRAEATSIQNTRLFSTLVEQAPMGVYVIDQNFCILQVNRLALPAFHALQPLLGRDFSDMMTITWGPDVGLRITAIFRHTLLTGERYSSNDFTELRHDLGVKKSHVWEVQRVTLSDGQFGVVCYFNDVTVRRQEEDSVAERAAHVRSIIDNTQAFIGLLSLDGTLLEANVSALAAVGIHRDRVVGKKLWDSGLGLRDPVEITRLKDAVTRAAAGETVRYDMILHSATGVRMDVDFMLAPVRDTKGTVILLVPSGLDITERKKSFDQIQLLMGEVNHRAMNMLGVIQAVARQTARDGDPATFVTRLTDRIAGLAASQDLLVQNEWQGVAVDDLVRAQLAHYRGLFDTQVLIEGPVARLSAAAAQGIGMALHELATNAGKYGSLSTAGGRVDVTWSVIDGATPHFEMLWREAGGPPVTIPSRKGFGQKVIGTMVEASVNGIAQLEYPTSGFSWTLTAPVADTLEGGRHNAATAPVKK